MKDLETGPESEAQGLACRFDEEAMGSDNDQCLPYISCISITLFHQRVFTSIMMAMDQPSNVTR